MPTRPEVELRSDLHICIIVRTNVLTYCPLVFLHPPARTCLFFPTQYCESPFYTTWEPSAAETVKVAFQCRQLDGTYSIGQETIRAGSTRIDPLFSNNEVEWYTERIGSAVLYGLLIQVDIA